MTEFLALSKGKMESAIKKGRVVIREKNLVNDSH